MSPELTPEEQQELVRLKTIIQAATADGILTEAERRQITETMRADGKVTYEELDLIRRLVYDKVNSGELTLED